MVNRQLKITYLLAANFPRGGIKVQIEHANRLARLGHRVSILSSVDPPDWIEVTVPWEKTETGRGKFLGSRIPQCDLVVFSFYEQAYALLKPSLQAGAVPIYFAQGDEILFGDPATVADEKSRQNVIAAQTSVKFPFPILTVSKTAAARLEDFGGNDVSVIHNGIDRDIFLPGVAESDIPLRVLSVGSEFPRFKGIFDLYAALIKLKREEDVLEFTFIRVAPGENTVGNLPIKVEYHQNPTQGELADIYAGADIFIGPSHNESFYLPPLEAMSCGTATICANLPAVREYAEPGRDFLAYPPGNVPELHRVIKELLLSREKRERLVRCGLAVAERMSWDNIIGELNDYFMLQLERKAGIHKALEEEIRNPSVKFKIGPGRYKTIE